MIRAKIIAEGKVQRVGYREKVQEAARELNIAGRVRNLKSGNVEIICEGEKQDVENFIKVIEIKDELIEVKKITQTFEEATGEFEHFEIEYGELQEELTESIGAGRRELIAIRETLSEKMDTVGKNVVEVGGKIDAGFSQTSSNFKILGEKIDSGFSKMDSNFKSLGEKVDSVGDKIDSGFSKMDSNFKDLDGKYDVVSKELKSINANISKLADYLGGLLSELVKKKKPAARKTARRTR